MIQKNNWNCIRIRADIYSIDFKERGFIIYYGFDKTHWKFYRYSDIKTISAVTQYNLNLYCINDYVIDEKNGLTKKYYKCCAYRDCGFSIELYDSPKRIDVSRRFWTPLMKMKKIQNPTLIEKIKSNFYFKMSGLRNLDHQYFKWTAFSNDELKEMFEEKNNEFKKSFNELKVFNDKFIEKINK